MTLHFYFDLSSPYAYLAAAQIHALPPSVQVRWRPISLAQVRRSLGVVHPEPPPASAGKRRLLGLDLDRRALLLGLPPVGRAPPLVSDAALEWVLRVEPAARPALAWALFEARFQRRADLDDPAVLARLATPLGVDAAAVHGHGTRLKAALADQTREAVDCGVFGVPTFRVGDQAWWGADRLAEALGHIGVQVVESLPEVDTGATVEVFHDVASPFSYLGVGAIDAVARRAGASVVFTPILLGALFRSIGTPMVPLHTFSPPRQRGQRLDLARWAARRGLPLRFPTTFPLRTVLVQRVLICEPRATQAVYRAAWADDRDVGDTKVLGAVLDEAGFGGAGLLQAATHPDIKDRLRSQTARAERIGVCGVPSFLVGGEVLVWGQDRLDHVARALRGWRPDVDGP